MLTYEAKGWKNSLNLDNFFGTSFEVSCTSNVRAPRWAGSPVLCGHGQPLAPAGVTAQAGTPRRPWAARPGGSGRAGTRRHAAPGSPGAASASSSGAAPAGSPRSPGPFLRPRSRCRAPAPATGPRAPPGPRCTRAHASAVVTIHGVREELEQKGRSCDGRGCGRGPGHAPLGAPGACMSSETPTRLVQGLVLRHRLHRSLSGRVTAAQPGRGRQGRAGAWLRGGC